MSRPPGRPRSAFMVAFRDSPQNYQALQSTRISIDNKVVLLRLAFSKEMEARRGVSLNLRGTPYTRRPGRMVRGKYSWDPASKRTVMTFECRRQKGLKTILTWSMPEPFQCRGVRKHPRATAVNCVGTDEGSPQIRVFPYARESQGRNPILHGEGQLGANTGALLGEMVVMQVRFAASRR